MTNNGDVPTCIWVKHSWTIQLTISINGSIPCRILKHLFYFIREHHISGFFLRASIFRYVRENILFFGVFFVPLENSSIKWSHENIRKSWKMYLHKNDTVLKLSIGFHEIFSRTDLIHCFRVEFVEKTWLVNTLIYGIVINVYSCF